MDYTHSNFDQMELQFSGQLNNLNDYADHNDDDIDLALAIEDDQAIQIEYLSYDEILEKSEKYIVDDIGT